MVQINFKIFNEMLKLFFSLATIFLETDKVACSFANFNLKVNTLIKISLWFSDVMNICNKGTHLRVLY